MKQANPMLDLVDKIGIGKLMTLKKYADYKSSDVNHLVVSDVAQVLGFQPTASVVANVTARIQADDPNSLFDWISEPDNLSYTLGALNNTEAKEDLDGPELVMCPHCNGVFERSPIE